MHPASFAARIKLRDSRRTAIARRQESVRPTKIWLVTDRLCITLYVECLIEQAHALVQMIRGPTIIQSIS